MRSRMVWRNSGLRLYEDGIRSVAGPRRAAKDSASVGRTALRHAVNALSIALLSAERIRNAWRRTRICTRMSSRFTEFAPQLDIDWGLSCSGGSWWPPER